jgi:uncharacterized Zn-finger protein
MGAFLWGYFYILVPVPVFILFFFRALVSDDFTIQNPENNLKIENEEDEALERWSHASGTVTATGTSLGNQPIHELSAQPEISPEKCRQTKHSCLPCDKAFSSMHTLRRHIRMVHTPMAIAAKKIKTPDKPLCCSLCNQAFSRADHLRRHFRVHTGEKPHSRMVHIPKAIEAKKINTPDKPFCCSLCNQAFSRADHLRRHIRVHTGEKPHSCSVCGDTFARADHRSAHQRNCKIKMERLWRPGKDPLETL